MGKYFVLYDVQLYDEGHSGMVKKQAILSTNNLTNKTLKRWTKNLFEKTKNDIVEGEFDELGWRRNSRPVHITILSIQPVN